jgi:hypothetical protein
VRCANPLSNRRSSQFGDRGCTGRLVFCRMTIVRGATCSPWAMSTT